MKLVLKHLEFESERVNKELELMNEEDSFIKKIFAFQEPLTYLEKQDKIYLLENKKKQFEDAIELIKRELVTYKK